MMKDHAERQWTYYRETVDWKSGLIDRNSPLGAPTTLHVKQASFLRDRKKKWKPEEKANGRAASAYCSAHSAISVYCARQAQLKATRILREVGKNCNVAVVFQ